MAANVLYARITLIKDPDPFSLGYLFDVIKLGNTVLCLGKKSISTGKHTQEMKYVYRAYLSEWSESALREAIEDYFYKYKCYPRLKFPI